MIPLALLPQLTPLAAKLYLTLLATADPSTPTRTTLTIQNLAQLTAFTPRSCYTALRQLRSLNLITRLPSDHIHPTTYLLNAASPVNSPSLPPLSAPSPPHAKTPLPASKTHPLNPPSPLLNPFDLDLLRTYMHALPTAQQSSLIAQAHAVLTRLNTQESHP